MNILIINGSPRKSGNTELLAEAFAKGAAEQHHVEIVSVRDYKVNPCLGSGTGQLKLRFVWNMAIERFDWLDRVMEFDKFSYYVDLALVWMREQLERNANISNYVEGGNADDTGTEEVHTDDR